MLKTTKVDMTSGPITRGLLTMTIPIMIMNVMQNLFSIIDMTVLGKFGSDNAVGSVGACGMLITLCTGLLIGISAGSNVVVAKRIGEGNRERAEEAVGTAMLLSLVGGILLLVIGSVFAETFLRWTNCPESLLSDAVLYFRLYFFGTPSLMLYSFGAAVLRASGDTKRPMYFLMFGGVVKILLNLLFITVFDMTVDGVAIATIISNTIAGGLCLVVLLRSRDVVHFSFKKMRFYMPELRETLFVGIPTGLQSALYSLANVVITTAVNGFGPAATTGISIANQFDGILYNISCAPALATIPYVAQNVGAGNIKRVKQTLVRSILITIAFGATLGAASAIFSGELSGIMSKTPEVIMYSRQKMIIISSTYFICGINEVMGGVMRGLGKPIIPTVATFIFMCVLRFIWVYLIFPFVPNLTFLYLVWPIGWVSSIATLLIAYFPAIKKLQQKYQTL